MTEEFLQFIWKLKLFENRNLYSTCGDKIEIVDIGRQNIDAGPDFVNARIRINDLLWVGNVEMHLKSSLWYRHNHHKDRAYENVILHVVINDDAQITTSENHLLPCLILKFNKSLWDNYSSLMNSDKWIPCYNEINIVNKFFVKNWLDRILLERLERKAADIKLILEKNNFSWEESFYHILSKYFGMKVNADPFQQLAQSLPLKILARQKNSLLQIEALLFGQAGLLKENSCEDEYTTNLKSEYHFLANKYQLSEMPMHRWKWLRLRPVNFPTIRIALLAALIYNSSALFSKIKSCSNTQELLKLFEVEVSDYWMNHYQFGKQSEYKNKRLGKAAAIVLVVNAVVPILFCYAEINKNQVLKDRAISFLSDLPAENNSIIKKWKNCGVEIDSAWDSQALLQLKSTYCDKYMCLQCEFGNRIIRLKDEKTVHK